ncbi:MAG: hypothetical protein F4207_11150, partial [Gemmatimonadetes bacterium]|nr:hypothetical protein [Gemmatimonadota bacterium]
PPPSPTVPDLVVVDWVADRTSVVLNQDVNFKATIANRGTRASAPTTIRFLVSSNSTITTADQELEMANVPTTAPNEGGTWNVSVSSRRSQTAYFGVCIDPVSGETNTQNNCSQGIQIRFGTGAGGSIVDAGQDLSSESFEFTVKVR